MRILITESQFKNIIISEGKVKSNERVKIYDTDEWLVVVPLTHRASCKYGAYTSWCVAVPSNDSHFNRYIKNGILFYCLNKKNLSEKYSYFHSTMKNHYGRLSGWYDKDDNNETGVPVKGDNPFNLPNSLIESIKNYIKDRFKNIKNTGKEEKNNFNEKGEKNGYWEEYYDNGIIQSKGTYVDGDKEGYWEFYDTNGKLRMSGFYKTNKKSGNWSLYNNGNLISTKFYTFKMNESFEKKQTLDILNIEKKGKSLRAVVGNNNDIEGVIGVDEVRGFVNIGFDFTENNVNKSVSAWLKMVSMSPIILGMYVKENNPDLISVSTVSDQMARIYKSNNFIDLFQHYIGSNYYPLSDKHTNIIFYVNKNVSNQKIEDLIEENIKWVERNIRTNKKIKN